jgi:hypothetical protein
MTHNTKESTAKGVDIFPLIPGKNLPIMDGVIVRPISSQEQWGDLRFLVTPSSLGAASTLQI